MRYSLASLLAMLLCAHLSLAARLTPEEITAVATRLDLEHAAVRRCDQGLEKLLQFVREHPEIFTEERAGLFTFEEKEILWSTWKQMLDYQTTLEAVGRSNARYYRLRGPLSARSFYAGHAAALVQYRHALDFLALTANHSAVDKLLNEGHAGLSLEPKTYAQFKFRFLNAGRGLEFAARDVLYNRYARRNAPENRDLIDRHTRRIWQMGKGRGPALTAGNALKMIRQPGFTAWLPVQAGVSEWMGDTKLLRHGEYLITQEQIAALDLQPGDILLERRDWYLSNAGLPGFWPHAALYIGTSAERRVFFRHPDVQSWVRSQGEASGEFETLLAGAYPKAFARCAQTEEGQPLRVLEAISDGVVFTTLERSAQADSLAVLRPTLTPADKAAAIFRAFHYAGRPYDFNFDLDTDATLVCTELVCKAYTVESSGQGGLQFPVRTMLGRKVTPANEIVRQFDEQFGTAEQQCTLVCFLDGNEKAGRAFPASLEEFRSSWRRPKWHILIQGR